MLEMYKLKIGDRCWSGELLGDLTEWELESPNAILKEGENLESIKLLIKEQTLASELISEMYRRD